MTNRPAAPRGAPCWIDLWTSDIEGSRRFYAELFGWQAGEPSPDHGGYFMFTRAGVPVAGAMGDMGETRASNTWKPFFATDDIERTLKLAAAHGATVDLPAMAIDDLGSQAVISDPAGAVTGIWQPGSFAGFTAVHEHGTPSFIAIDVHDYQGRSPSIARCSAGIHSRRRPTVITTPATWTRTATDRSPGSAMKWTRWRPENRPTGLCSFRATMSTPQLRNSA